LLAHGRWFFPGSPVSSTTKTGRPDIAEILLKVALKHQKSIKSNQRMEREACWFYMTNQLHRSPNGFILVPNKVPYARVEQHPYVRTELLLTSNIYCSVWLINARIKIIIELWRDRNHLKRWFN
jgi:hypothetical protein